MGTLRKMRGAPSERGRGLYRETTPLSGRPQQAQGVVKVATTSGPDNSDRTSPSSLKAVTAPNTLR